MLKPVRLLIAILALNFLWAPLPTTARAQDKTITIFAAASVKNVVDDINGLFQKLVGVRMIASYAATSALVRQIEQGAPADVFISADIDWMDYAAARKLLKRETRFDLASNRLVLIASRESPARDIAIGPGFDLAQLAGGGRIAVGDTRAVPAGRYAKAALEKLGAWNAAEPRLAMVENVRVALALVARGEAPLGIVYETDAKIEPLVRVIGRFPHDSHPPIVYPIAETASANAEAAKYLAFLRADAARVIFEHHGFTYLVKAGH